MSSLTIRRMEARDLEAGLRLTQSQRWSHRLEDWDFHFRLGRGWVACGADDKPIASAFWWPYGDSFATVGLVIVDPEHQGKGIGRQLLATVMNDAGPRVLQLMATQAGLKLYQQNGFRECGGIAQCQGTPAPAAFSVPPRGVVLRPVRREDQHSLSDLDAAASGVPRHRLLHAVFETGQGGVVAEQMGRVAGFALKRLSGRGTVIGPVLASDETLAIALISRVLSETTGFVRLDVPTDARELGAWLEGVGLPCIDTVTKMIRGTPPALPADARVFGLVSQALG